MRKICFALVLVLALTVCLSAAADTLFVDNQEADKSDLMRLNMRATPSANGSVIGSFYTGAEVTVLDDGTNDDPTSEPEIPADAGSEGTEGETPEEEVPSDEFTQPEPAAPGVSYIHVEIGGIQGYMSDQYLITAEEAAARYGTESTFGQCRDADVDLTGMWVDYVNLYEYNSSTSNVVGTIANGEKVHMVGIISGWAYIYKDTEEGKLFGFLPIDVVTETGALKVFIVSSTETDGRLPLYENASEKSKVTLSLGNGTTLFMLFGRGEGEWRRVRVGGISGWVKPGKKVTILGMGGQARSSIPYYPLVMETRGDALLYSVKGDKSKSYMTLGSQMKVEVLGETSEYVYARTLIGGAGAYDKGDYGYIALSDLTLAQATSTIGVIQADDDDLPVLVYREPEANSNVLGALCGGAQVRLLDYTQTDFVRIAMNDMTGYVLKSCVRILTQETDPLSDRIAQRGTAKQDIILLSEPSERGAETGMVAAGSRLYMLGKFGDWMYVNADASPNLSVTTNNETCGFVRLSQLSAPASTTHLLASTMTDKVNLRSIGDLTGDIIGRVRLGELLRVTDYGNNWTCVVTPEGKRGYIMTEYLFFE